VFDRKVPAVEGNIHRVKFHGGGGSAVLLIGLFLGVVIWITSIGLTSIQAYLAPLCLILGLSIFLSVDRRKACDALLAGIADRTLATMLLAFLGAGAFGQLLVASGLIEGIVRLGDMAGVGDGLFVVLSFLVAAVIATAIGTSTGTCVTVVPVLYPAGVLLGAHPALLLGAIYSGARFGDNIAPISDTTVASAYTQEADVGEVVSSRLKYALAAGGISILLYVAVGSFLEPSSATGTEAVIVGGHSLASLWMLLAPALTVVLCLRGQSLIEALWAGIFLAIVLGLVTGTLAPHQIYFAEAPKTVGGALTEGIVSMRDVIFLAIFVMALVGLLREAGALDGLVRTVLRFATTPQRAELSIFILVSLMCPLCAGNTPAMLFSGPVVSQIGRQHDIHRARRANLMDLAGNGVTENLPHINTMLALAGVMIVAHETTGAPLVPVTDVGLLAFHPMALTVVGLFAIATGWGARRG
jgi:Na+/H+ antiporter NhaC